MEASFDNSNAVGLQFCHRAMLTATPPWSNFRGFQHHLATAAEVYVNLKTAVYAGQVAFRAAGPFSWLLAALVSAFNNVRRTR